jgi:5-methylthioadenosine/S-adenosylhomocysteine deaminase
LSILIKNILVNGTVQDIFIQGNRIHTIGECLSFQADIVINGSSKAAIPGFFNAHTHTAMTLLRGYSDDLPVHEWLEKKIWPLEVNLTEEDVYWGTKLACLEMIKSGTIFFNDMYWHYHGTAQAVEEMGIRAVISAVLLDRFDPQEAARQIALSERLFQETQQYSDRIQFALGPHGIYTVSTETLRWAKVFADKYDCLIHIHLSESKGEVEDCLKRYGKRPVEYLCDIGFLGPNVVAAHAVWITEKEMDILWDHDVKIAHNPVSNMKLSSGTFAYQQCHKRGIKICLGTDSCASNNNLDLLEEAKIAALLEKINTMNPTGMPAAEAFQLITEKGAEIFRIDAGTIAEGKLADLVLVNLQHPSMVPLHDLTSNLIYAASGDVVDTTICDGRILMLNGHVEAEQEIVKQAEAAACRLIRSL